MSFLAKLLGSSGKSGKSPTPQEAIQKLRETEEMMIKKQEFLEKKIDEELALAKKHGTKNKRSALLALKRKKRYMKQLDQIDGTLSTIELQREMLENATSNTEVLKNMNYASKAIKAAHKDMDVDKVHDLLDEIAEQNEIAQEITDAISIPRGMADDFDEDELLSELEELEQEEMDKKLLEVEGTEDVSLPSVPPSSLPTVPTKKKEEEDLDGMEELASWATS
ncbi:charged multivesicular body protein 4b-like [Synchiropus picturatus]